MRSYMTAEHCSLLDVKVRERKRSRYAQELRDVHVELASGVTFFALRNGKRERVTRIFDLFFGQHIENFRKDWDVGQLREFV